MGKFIFASACIAAFLVGNPSKAQAQGIVSGSYITPTYYYASPIPKFYGYAPYGTGVVVGEGGVAHVEPVQNYRIFSKSGYYGTSSYYPSNSGESGYYARSFLFQRH